MDCQMPVMDGLTATRELRALEEQHGWSRLPVIAMTAFVTPVEIQRCLDAGMDGHLGKPFEPEQLRQILMGHARGVVSDLSEPDSTALPDNDDSTAKVLNLDTLKQLEELLGSDIVMILEAFLEQLPDLVQEVIQGIETDNQELAYRAAHTLKSSAANVGGMRVSEQSAEIERIIKTVDKSELSGLAQRLSTESDRLACALRDFLQSCKQQG
jgi:CheY-like chemotaxis protein